MDRNELQDELRQSMLSRESIKTSVMRMLSSAVKNYEIQKGGAGYTATEQDILQVINKEAKQRRDSIEEYKKANRQDLADKEFAELKILESYLPEQMPEDEIQKIIEETLSEIGASSIQDMGKVMGVLTGKLKGKTDMGKVSEIVREKLQK